MALLKDKQELCPLTSYCVSFIFLIIIIIIIIIINYYYYYYYCFCFCSFLKHFFLDVCVRTNTCSSLISEV